MIESSALKQCFQQSEHKEKTLSGSEVIGLHFGYPGDRMVSYAGLQTELQLKIIPAFTLF